MSETSDIEAAASVSQLTVENAALRERYEAALMALEADCDHIRHQRDLAIGRADSAEASLAAQELRNRDILHVNNLLEAATAQMREALEVELAEYKDRSIRFRDEQRQRAERAEAALQHDRELLHSIGRSADRLEKFLGDNSGNTADWPIDIIVREDANAGERLIWLLNDLAECLKPFRKLL